MYTYNTKVSYSRLDKSGKVPYHEIINYLQDCSTFQSEELGVGVEHLKAQNKAWVMLAHKIQILRELQLGEEIIVGTCPTDFGKVMATRQFFIKDKTGAFVVKAESIWGLIDIQERIPIRIREEDYCKYMKETAFESIKPSRKIRFTGQGEIVGNVTVHGIDIDTNGHVNNANYLRMISDYLSKDGYYNQVEIVYNKEALEGENIKCTKYYEEDGIGMILKNDEEETHAQIKFKKI
ncbi:MAG: hypothetical protein HFG28_02150 [Eubacterium sp.]|nr:hypothetical protein [Eubacterium sp.]